MFTKNCRSVSLPSSHSSIFFLSTEKSATPPLSATAAADRCLGVLFTSKAGRFLADPFDAGDAGGGRFLVDNGAGTVGDVSACVQSIGSSASLSPFLSLVLPMSSSSSLLLLARSSTSASVVVVLLADCFLDALGVAVFLAGAAGGDVLTYSSSLAVASTLDTSATAFPTTSSARPDCASKKLLRLFSPNFSRRLALCNFRASFASLFSLRSRSRLSSASQSSCIFRANSSDFFSSSCCRCICFW
mmetsp:Transcript_24555/g.57575  ORF Transcript_24555/g.57575 Transcript_24555/m.57575 type:complete len:245 (+) Transcript_24555:148-882(+)